MNDKEAKRAVARGHPHIQLFCLACTSTSGTPLVLCFQDINRSFCKVDQAGKAMHTTKRRKERLESWGVERELFPTIPGVLLSEPSNPQPRTRIADPCHDWELLWDRTPTRMSWQARRIRDICFMIIALSVLRTSGVLVSLLLLDTREASASKPPKVSTDTVFKTLLAPGLVCSYGSARYSNHHHATRIK